MVIGSHYHFWFFPALIVSISLVTLFYRQGLQKLLFSISVILYIIVCLGCSYRTLGNQIPGLSQVFGLDAFQVIRRIFLMGFPFFTAGMAVEWMENHRHKTEANVKIHMLGLFFFACMYLIEIAFVKSNHLGDNVVLTFFLYPLTVCVFVSLLRNPGKYGKFSEQCQMCADWTYYIHPIVVWGIKHIGSDLGIHIEETMMFALTNLGALISHRLFLGTKKQFEKMKLYK